MSVSLDNNRENLIKAIAKDKLNWHHVSSLKIWKSEAAGLYHIRSIPANFLIDPSGKIIDSNLHGDKLDLALEKIFN